MPHQLTQLANRQRHLLASHCHINGLTVVKSMEVGVAVVHLEIAERIAAQAFFSHLPGEAFAVAGHLQEMPGYLVETHPRLSSHRHLLGGRQVETLDRQNHPVLYARQHQHTQCHEAKRETYDDAVVFVHWCRYNMLAQAAVAFTQRYGGQIYI